MIIIAGLSLFVLIAIGYWITCLRDQLRSLEDTIVNQANNIESVLERIVARGSGK